MTDLSSGVAPSGPRLPLSVFVVTLNEESNLQRALTSIHDLSREVVVVDSGSSDATETVARFFGARWHHQDWLGFREQKKVALGLCTEPWVFLLDADEELSPKLRSSLIDFFQSSAADSHDGAACNRCTRFLGRWIRHGDWYPDRKLRLFRRDKVTLGGSPEHETAEVPGPVLRLEGDLHHYSFPTINRYLEKISTFGDVFLERELEAGREWSLTKNLTRPVWRFFRSYILRLGFLDGFPGLWIAVGNAFMTFVRYSKTFEHERAKLEATRKTESS